MLLKAIGVEGPPKTKAVGSSDRSEDQEGSLILLTTELKEGWGCHSQEKLSRSNGTVWPYLQGTLTYCAQ